jgi:hypothetical protein
MVYIAVKNGILNFSNYHIRSKHARVLNREINFQKNEVMIRCKDGQDSKDKRIFFRSRNDKRTQRVFLQRRGGANNSDTGFSVWFAQHQSNTPMGVKSAGARIFTGAFFYKKCSVLLLAAMLAEAD